jgi:hypothetical protein
MPQLRILPLRALMDVTFCLTRSGATKEACIIQCGVMQQRFRGNRSTYHIHYTLYTVYLYSSLAHPPSPPPLKIANQHPWPCQPPPPHGSRCSLSLVSCYPNSNPYAIYAETTALMFSDLLSADLVLKDQVKIK